VRITSVMCVSLMLSDNDKFYLLVIYCSSDQLRITRTSSLNHQDLGDEVEFLGYENEKFKFEHLVNRVEFISCSVDKDEFDNIKEWITDVESGY